MTDSLTQLIERDGQAVARRMNTVRVSVLDGPDKGAVFEDAFDYHSYCLLGSTRQY